MAVEKAFGLLKIRFRRIKFFTEYRDISFVSEVVTLKNLEEHVYEEQYQNNNNCRDHRMAIFRELFPNAQVA